MKQHMEVVANTQTQPEIIPTDLSYVSLVETTPEMDAEYFQMLQENKTRLLAGGIDIDAVYKTPDDIQEAREHGQKIFEILHEGTLTGGVEITPMDENNVEISFWKDKNTVGAQTAKVAVSAIVRRYLSHGINVHASVAPSNDPSFNLLSRLKFNGDESGTHMVRRAEVVRKAAATAVRNSQWG